MNLKSKTEHAGQYYLLEKIAQGGMAEIFKGLAYDQTGIKRTVCIKKILPHIAASREFIDMLVDEAKIAVKLSQGNIAQIYDLGKAGNDYFMVMEYVEGQTLSRIHKKIIRTHQKMPLPMVLHLIAEVASGLNYMHRKTDEEGSPLGIIHRDISPQNIMISYSGTVKIIDFGIAKAAAKIGHTESGVLKGKFAYMSPEQAEGNKLDHRTDIFSLGVILHEILASKRLFKGADNKETLRNVRRVNVLPPSRLNPEIPPELDAIVMKSLSKDRRHRFAFASDFREELLKFLHFRTPDFKPSEVAEYLCQLFHEERLLAQALEEEPTPQPIIEATSEITMHGPQNVDWKEYLLEEELPEKIGTSASNVQKNKEEESEISKEERTAKKLFPKWTFKKELGLWCVGMILVATLTFFGWRRQQNRSPSPAPFSGAETEKVSQRNVPLLGKAVVESNPAGAKIFIEDQDTGWVTPHTLEKLTPHRKYHLGLYLKDYKFFKTEWEAKPGESSYFHVEMVIDFGALKISSIPSGATVWMENHLIGNTPFIKEGLKPGVVSKIAVKMEGYLPHEEEIQIQPGQEKVLLIRLKRQSPSFPKP